MYLSYYQLETKPFQISTDPEFLWLGEKHKEALAVLKYGVLDNKGFLLLTGEVGTGKTTLINALVNSLGDEVTVATILDPGLEKEDFYNYIISSFNLPGRFVSKGDFIRQFSAFLNESYDQRKKTLLIIDEAQRLNQMLLEEIRLLSNIERQTAKLINIFFVGQKEFNNIILDPKNRALRQRITVNYDLKSLSLKETDQYIRHRLKVAGRDKTIFKSAAIREIYKFAKGYPRLINVICDRALLTGYTKDEQKISAKIIKECAAELTLKLKNQKPGKPPVPEKIKSTSRSTDLTMPSLGSYVEKGLYLILFCMIAAWLTAAAYFYLPKTFVSSYLQKTFKENIAKKPYVEKKPFSEPDAADTISNAGASEDISGNSPSTQDLSVSFKQTLRIQDLFPDINSVVHIDLSEEYELSEDSLNTLTKIASLMAHNAELTILIKGYAGDRTENYRYNKKMSEFTANVVKGFLVGKGVSPQRIETTGIWLINPETDTNLSPGSQNARWVKIQRKNG